MIAQKQPYFKSLWVKWSLTRVLIVGASQHPNLIFQKITPHSLMIMNCHLLIGCVSMRQKTKQKHFYVDSLAECYSVVRKRSEEHTSELQSRGHLVCRLLLENK